MFRKIQYREVSGVVLFLLSIILFLAIISYTDSDFARLFQGSKIHNLIGSFGALVSHYGRAGFGMVSYLFSLIFLFLGISIIRGTGRDEITGQVIALLFLLLTLSALAAGLSQDVYQRSGGIVGHYILSLSLSLFGGVGAYLVIIMVNVIGMILLGIVSINTLLDRTKDAGGVLVGMKNLREKFFGKKTPLNTIEESLIKTEKKRNNRLPWIEKKRILIYESEVPLDNTRSAREYLQLALEHDGNGAGEQDQLPYDRKESSEYIGYEEPGCDTHLDDSGFDDIDTEEDIIDNDGDTPGPVHGAARRKEEVVDLSDDEEENFIEVEAVSEQEDDELETLYTEIPINEEYIIPVSFLYVSKTVDAESWKSEIKKNSILLVNTLADFGIESKVVNVNRGPVVTLYEVQIAPGIKVNRIVGLADDIAMALAAYRVRIVAPIPGKSAIGVEIPNSERESVTLGDIIMNSSYQSHLGKLKVGLGKDILGTPIMLDLKKLPHLLIAGATGAGKSVCVNGIITSLIYNYDPNYVRFIMVDPKMVELQLYNGLPHLLTPVIIEPSVAPNALKWAMYEMDRRYRLLSRMNTRDIDRYNEKADLISKDIEKLPFIVIIIDELADLMMVASKEIEGYITRIAQKARAVGIHLVIATQRPSVDIITGIIKANFPARIAFQVAQKTDSRTIIDQNGAEKLLGKGDMLYLSPSSSYPIRIQGAYISEDEIIQVVKHCSQYAEPDYIDIEESLFNDEGENGVDGNGDELFTEALKIVEETRKASASYLQRRLSIGYNRAARIIEQMEELGYVGPQQGSKPRDIYI